MLEFDTLEEAREEVRKWTGRTNICGSPTDVTLVKIISTHREGEDIMTPEEADAAHGWSH